MNSFVLHGNIIYSKNKDEFEIVENGYLVCKDGLSAGVYSNLPGNYIDFKLIDCGNKIIIPGFTDLHVHAPQYNFRSVGMDCELLDWLNLYAFNEESKFIDLDYAKKAYSLFVEDMKNGFTTRACIFGTLHTHSTVILMELLEKSGLNTMVGKVNMDRNAPEYLCEESANKSLQETETFIELSKKFKNTNPIITPRFIPSCTDKLMEGLSDIIKKHNLPIQSHLSENPSEIEWVKELCPFSTSYGNAYEHFGMMNNKTIMAHCVHMTDEEMKIVKEKGVFVAHCPESNMNLSSGIAPISEMLQDDINVGLGSDVAGGTTLSIPKAMVLAIQCSKIRWRYLDNSHKPLTLENAFYMATRGGGKFFGNVGSLDKGFEFDVLVLDDTGLRTTIDYGIRERLERIIYLGNESNINSKYVAGKMIF